MARFLTLVVTLWLLLGPGRSAAQPAAPLQLSLQQAVSMALENNETFLIAQMETGKSRSRYREALSEALPSLNLNTVYTRNWSLQELNFGGQRFRLGTDNAMNMRLDFSQPIYSGGKLRAGLKLASYFRDQTDANEEAVRQNVALSVHQSYYSVVLADAILKVNEASYERAVVQFGQVSKFNAAGTVSAYDVLRAEVQVANSKPPVIQAKNRLAVAKARLKSLIGVRQTTGVIIRSDLNAEYNIPSSLEEALQTASQKRPDVMASRLQTDMMDRSIVVARSEGRPDISLSAGYQMQAQVNDNQINGLGFADFTRSLNTQLNISIPIFDGRQTSSRVSQAEADYELAQFSESRLNRQVEVDVTEAYLNVQEATDRISAAQEAVALAQRGLEIARVQYGAGMSTQLEVIDAELALTQAQTNHVTARHDYAVTAAILESVQGILEIGPR